GRGGAEVANAIEFLLEAKDNASKTIDDVNRALKNLGDTAGSHGPRSGGELLPGTKNFGNEVEQLEKKTTQLERSMRLWSLPLQQLVPAAAGATRELGGVVVALE